MSDKFKISAKNSSGKWWSYGNLKKNEWGNWNIGIRATAELKEKLNAVEEGGWVNFSCFADDGEQSPATNSATNDSPVESDSIPF